MHPTYLASPYYIQGPTLLHTILGLGRPVKGKALPLTLRDLNTSCQESNKASVTNYISKEGYLCYGKCHN